MVVTTAPPCGKTYAMTPNTISFPLLLILSSKPTKLYNSQAILVWNLSCGFGTFLIVPYQTSLNTFLMGQPSSLQFFFSPSMLLMTAKKKVLCAH